MPAPFTAAPRDRVLVALELALDDDDDAGLAEAALDILLEQLGAAAIVEVEAGTADRLVVVEDLVEALKRFRDLELRGRDALDLDDVPRGVSLSRLLDDERERAYGEVDRLVEAIAARLPA